MTWGASDTPSLGSVFKGTADQQVTLALRSGGLCARLGVSGHRHPVDSGRGQRFVTRHPRPEINEHHHAARRGLSLSFHAPTMGQGKASVTLQPNGIAQ